MILVYSTAKQSLRVLLSLWTRVRIISFLDKSINPYVMEVDGRIVIIIREFWESQLEQSILLYANSKFVLPNNAKCNATSFYSISAFRLKLNYHIFIISCLVFLFYILTIESDSTKCLVLCYCKNLCELLKRSIMKDHKVRFKVK